MAAKKDFKKDNPVMNFISNPETEEKEEPATTATAPQPETINPGTIGKPPAGYKINPLYIETKTKRVNLVLQPSLAERMKRSAQKQGVSVNEMVSEVMRNYLDELGVE